MITQKFNFPNKFGRKNLWLLLLVWITITAPLCFVVYMAIHRRLRIQTQDHRVEQERVLREVFERDARFGDLVNAKANVAAVGSAMGLESILVCKDGQDVIGGLVPIHCLAGGPQHEVQISGENLALQFQWPDRDISYDPILLNAVLWTCLLTILAFVAFIWAIYTVLLSKVRILSQRMAVFDSVATGGDFDYEIPEFEPIGRAFTELQARVRESNEKIVSLSSAEATANLARQVAHDIRSPLSALKIFAAKFSAVDGVGQLVTEAVARIEGIARDLLSTGGPTIMPSRIGATFFEKIVALKCEEFGSEVSIFLEFSAHGLEKFVPAFNRDEIFRCLSNLMNNSVEAAEGRKASLRLKIAMSDSHLRISLSDNGGGIPPELLKDLGRQRVSTKASSGSGSGHGLGILYVFRTLERAGGRVQVEVRAGEGTDFHLLIPLGESGRA